MSWHRDREPRLHVPIITNPGCKMVIEDIAKHMPADGSVTLLITLNTTIFLMEGNKIEFI